MASRTLVTRAVIKGVDHLSGPLARMAGNTARVQTQMQRLNRSAMAAGASARNLRGGLMPGGSGSLLFGASLLGAYKFDKELRFFGATAELSKERLAGFRQELVDVAKVFPKTRQELLRASVEGVTAGLEVDTVQNLLKTVAKIAVATKEDMGPVMGSVTDIVMGANLKFKGQSADTQIASFERVAKTMVAASTMFNQKWGGFVSGMRHAVPVASALGIEVEQAAIMLGHLADAGFKGEQGGTALRTILIRAVAPTKKARKAMHAFGLDMNKHLRLDFKKLGDWERFNKQGKLIGGLKKSFKASGIQILNRDVGDLKKILNDPQLQKDAFALQEALTSFGTNRGYIDSKDIQNVQKFQEAVALHTVASSDGFDVKGLLSQLKDAPIAMLKEIAGVRRLPQLIALINNAHNLTGDQARLAKRMLGIIDRRAAKQMVGFAYSVDRLRGAWDAMMDSFERSGMLKSLSDLLMGPDNDEGRVGGLAAALERIGQLNPQVLKFGFLGALGLAVAGPMAMAVNSLVAMGATVAKIAGRSSLAAVAMFRLAAGSRAAAASMAAANAVGSSGFLFGVKNQRKLGAKAGLAASAGMVSGMSGLKGGFNKSIIAGMSGAGAARMGAMTGKTAGLLATLKKLGAYMPTLKGAMKGLFAVGRFTVVGLAIGAIAMNLDKVVAAARSLGGVFGNIGGGAFAAFSEFWNGEDMRKASANLGAIGSALSSFVSALGDLAGFDASDFSFFDAAKTAIEVLLWPIKKLVQGFNALADLVRYFRGEPALKLPSVDEVRKLSGTPSSEAVAKATGTKAAANDNNASHPLKATGTTGAPAPMTVADMQAANQVRAVTVLGVVNVRNADPLPLTGNINVNISGKVDGARTNATGSGSIGGPANKVPVTVTNNDKGGG